MPEDRYARVRDLAFQVLASALVIDLSRFRERKGGSEWAGPCPIHQAKRNNTAFSYSSDGKWNCFSCGEKGRGGIDLVIKVRRLGFQQAVEFLEPYTGHVASLPKPEIKQFQELRPTENEPFKSTYHQYFKSHAWLDARGLTREALARYGSGYYENQARRSQYNGSVMLRIRRWSDGEVVGYLSRNIGDITPEKPKYRFPVNFQKQLEVFGASELKDDGNLRLRIAYLVESPLTVIKFWQLGLPACSPFGWSLSAEQIQILAEIARGWVYLCDSDKFEQAREYAGKLSEVAWVKKPRLPEGVLDPEHLLLEQIRALT